MMKMWTANRGRLISLLGLALVLALFSASAEAASKFRLGLNADNWNNQVDSAEFKKSVRNLGIEFIVWHVSPEEFATRSLLRVVDYCRKNNLDYLFNTELVNYVPGVTEFAADGGRAYRWDLRPEIMEYLKDDPHFLGVVYDESLLVQSLLGTTIEVPGHDKIPVKPYYVDTAQMKPEAAFGAVADKIGQLDGYYRKYNKRLVLETLFPDSSFVTARGGAIWAVKFLKENYNDLMTMMAEGAARQYQKDGKGHDRGLQLWACVDLWYLETFPNVAEHGLGQSAGGRQGHTPDELYESLVYAYERGYDAAYVEMAKGLMDKQWKLTAHGQAVVKFNEWRQKQPARTADWRVAPQAQLTVRRFPSGNPGGRLAKFLDMRSYGSKNYRFSTCLSPIRRTGAPAAKTAAEASAAEYCVMDLEWWGWFRAMTGPGAPKTRHELQMLKTQLDALRVDGEKVEGVEKAKGAGNSENKEEGEGLGKAEAVLEEFAGTTFNSIPGGEFLDMFGVEQVKKLRGEDYQTLSALPETKFVDHTAPPLPAGDDQFDFYSSGQY